MVGWRGCARSGLWDLVEGIALSLLKKEKNKVAIGLTPIYEIFGIFDLGVIVVFLRVVFFSSERLVGGNGISSISGVGSRISDGRDIGRHYNR